MENRGTTYANMTITGTVAMQKAIQKQSMRNLVLIFPIVLILVSIVLFFFHRTIKGIIIAFLPPAFAIVLTFGVLGIVQPELTIMSVAIVALLIGLGVDYSIHLMNRYIEESDSEDKIERIEKILGMHIDIKELTAQDVGGTELAFDTSISKKHVTIYLDDNLAGKNVDIFLEGEYLITANIGKKGVIKLNKKSKLARIIQDAINMKEDIKIILKE